jgi:hypothetical protein
VVMKSEIFLRPVLHGRRLLLLKVTYKTLEKNTVRPSLLVFAELISSTLKMETICSSETSVETRRTTRRHIPDGETLHLTALF